MLDLERQPLQRLNQGRTVGTFGRPSVVFGQARNIRAGTHQMQKGFDQST